MKLVCKITAVLLVCLILFCSCSKKEQPVTLKYDLVESLETLDPQYATSSAALTIIENSFEGLTAVSPTGEVTPACAKLWEVSDNRLIYTFTLRDGLYWANGDPLKAQDFVFALQRLFNSDVPAPNAGNFSMIKNSNKILSGELSADSLGVRAKSDKVLEITLERDDPSLLSMLSHAAAMPCQQKFFKEQKGRYGMSAENLLCNGPFWVRSWSKSLVSINKNEKFRNPAQIDNIDLYINRGDSVSLFLEGESDLVFVPFQRMDEAQGVDGETFYDQSWMLIYNTNRHLLSDREIRSSFTAAMNIDELVERLPNYLQPYRGIIAPSAMLWGRLYRDLSPLPNRAEAPKEARQMFLSAMEHLEQNDADHLTLLVSNFEPGPDLGGAIQRRWQQELSTFVNMEQLGYYELISRVESGNFDMAIVPLTAQGNSPVEFLSDFENFNIPESSDGVSVSELISRARQQTESSAAAAQLLMAEQKLVDEYVVVPLFVSPSLFATREGIEGVSYSTISRTVYFANAKCVR